MKKNSRIFVAGGTGMVGSAVLRSLVKAGFNNLIASYLSKQPFCDLGVKWVRLDLRNQQDTQDFFAQYRPDYVFLCAAKVGGILANDIYKADFIYDNVMIGANVINSAYKFGVKKLLNLGSSCIYPKNCPQPIREEYLLTGKLEPTNEPYAIAKIATLKMCRYYNQQYGTNFISVMPTNLYGLNDNFHLFNSHVLPALIRKFYLARLLMEDRDDLVYKDILFWEKQDPKTTLEEAGISAEKVSLWGTGEVYREFLFVDDLAEAILFLMQNYDFSDIGEAINIGWGEDITIKNLAEIIAKIVGFKGKICWDTSKPDGTYRKLLDITKIKNLGWRPKVPLKEGIKITLNYYVEKMEHIYAMA